MFSTFSSLVIQRHLRKFSEIEKVSLRTWKQQSMLPCLWASSDPIPLDLKVILIGTDEIYHILYHDDEEFHKVFKIKADFDYKMDRTKKNINAYVSFIATRSEKRGSTFDKTELPLLSTARDYRTSNYCRLNLGDKDLQLS